MPGLRSFGTCTTIPVPAGAYFGSKKACEPLHVQYSYDDDSVAVVNGYDHAFPGARQGDDLRPKRGNKSVAGCDPRHSRRIAAFAPCSYRPWKTSRRPIF